MHQGCSVNVRGAPATVGLQSQPSEEAELLVLGVVLLAHELLDIKVGNLAGAIGLRALELEH